MHKDPSFSTTTFGIRSKGIRPLAEALSTIAEGGFRQVEISRKHPLTNAPQLLDEYGLTCWAVHGTMGYEAVSPDETVRRACVLREMQRMDEAARLGKVPYVVHYLDRHHDPAVGKRFCKSIDELLDHAARLGLSLAVETAPDKESLERYPDSREVAEFVRSFDHPNLSVCIDLNHSNLGEPLIRCIDNCAGLVSTVHVSDNDGKTEGHFVPGRGVIDFEASFGALARGGYTGPINLEIHLDDYPTVEQVREMKRWCDEMTPLLHAEDRT